MAQPGAIEFKIAYLKTVKRALAENSEPERFVDFLEKAFPDIPDKENLEKMAANLYA